MSRYRVEIPPVRVRGQGHKHRWETAADLVKLALDAQGITDYAPVDERFPGALSMTLRGVTVVQQYDVERDEWLACGIVTTPSENGAGA